MNFFFGFKNELISSELTIPKFNFQGKKIENTYKVFSAEIFNKSWKIDQTKIDEDDNFFKVDQSEINNKKIFFLSNNKELKIDKNNQGFLHTLLNFNSSADNDLVQFRSNLKIFNSKGGFSSYQSDYNYNLCRQGGNILSPISALLNKNATENFIIFRNILLKPDNNKFKYYFICLKSEKILDQGLITSNISNEIRVDNSLIKDSVFLFTENILGIPIFVTVDNHHISMEHTHPPHQYILTKDNFDLVKKIKNKFKEIVLNQ